MDNVDNVYNSWDNFWDATAKDVIFTGIVAKKSIMSKKLCKQIFPQKNPQGFRKKVCIRMWIMWITAKNPLKYRRFRMCISFLTNFYGRYPPFGTRMQQKQPGAVYKNEMGNQGVAKKCQNRKRQQAGCISPGIDL